MAALALGFIRDSRGVQYLSARASAGVDIDLVMRALYILAIDKLESAALPTIRTVAANTQSPRQVVRARHSGIAWRAYRRPTLRSRHPRQWRRLIQLKIQSAPENGYASAFLALEKRSVSGNS